MYGALKSIVSNLSTAGMDQLFIKQNQPFKFAQGCNIVESFESKVVELEKFNTVLNESRGIDRHIAEPDKIRMLKNVFGGNVELQEGFKNAAINHNGEPTYKQLKDALLNVAKYVSSVEQSSLSAPATVNNYANEAKVSSSEIDRSQWSAFLAFQAANEKRGSHNQIRAKSYRDEYFANTQNISGVLILLSNAGILKKSDGVGMCVL